MDIQEIKNYLKSERITYEQLSKKSGIPINTLKNIFSGRTPTPRIDTMQAIEKALGITQEPPAMSEQEKQLSDLIMQLTDDEVKELSSFVDYILSKRK